MPDRDAKGHFVKSAAQRIVEEKRPAGTRTDPGDLSRDNRSGSARCSRTPRQAHDAISDGAVDEPAVRTIRRGKV